jgi:hypothetical protein
MSAQTVLTCDSCGKTTIARNGMSPSLVREYLAKPKGWKTKRSSKMQRTIYRGTPHERTETFTEALDFCAECVASDKHKTTVRPII